MKKAFLLTSLLLTATSSIAAASQRLHIIGYRLGDSGINPNDGRIVATNCNGDVSTDLIALADNRLSSNAWFLASVPKGEEVLRWVAYNNDPADRLPSDTNNFAGAVAEYVWSYNPTDTADRYVVVDYDYISYTLKYDGNGGSGSMANEVYTYTQTFFYVILPQAVSTSVPGFVANMIFLLKETSVFSAISVMDLMFTAKDLIGMEYKTMEALTLLVVFYLIMLLPVSVLGSLVERRVRYGSYGD